MARVTVEDCMEIVGGNRFALVLLSTKRCRQLMAGARPLQENEKNKPSVLALREIASGKVRFDRNLRDALAGKFDDKRQLPTVLRPVRAG
jgi:DNA-directed RNA polymerase subunit omega